MQEEFRTLVRRDVEPLQVDSLPANIEFIPGQMSVMLSHDRGSRPVNV